MVDTRKLLDTLMGAVASKGTQSHQGGGLGDVIGQILGQATGQTAGMPRQAGDAAGSRAEHATGGAGGGASVQDLVQKAQDVMHRNPGLAQAALIGVAGLLMGSRKSRRGVASNLASLGGLAVIGGLAYKAFQNYQSGRPVLGGAPQAATAPTASLPQPAAFDPTAASDDDATRYIRAMVAAAAADGHLDENERQRILSGLSQAGIDADSARWLENEMSDPATVEELSTGVNTPEKAAQVYAAARVAIDPDTIQEREFLRRLAEELDLDPQLVAQIDRAASDIKISA